MIATYLVIGLVVIVLILAGVAWAAAAPAGDATRERSASRRRRFVETNPTHVNSHDIRCALVRAGITVEQARFVTDKASEHGIKAFTMWLWLEQFDAEALSIVVAADLTHRDLLTHISDGTVPDLDELKLFACANGLSTAAPQPALRHRTLVESGLVARKRPPMPAIYEPGLSGSTPSASRDDRYDGLAA